MPLRLTLSINIPDDLTTTKGEPGACTWAVSDDANATLPLRSNFTQFYSTKSERDAHMRKEYEAQMEYRRGLQAFIDRWRYNANRGGCAGAQLRRLARLRKVS